jgi:hypothetical protein
MPPVRLPELRSPKGDSGFVIALEGIDDLFYDNQTDPAAEIVKLQTIFDQDRNRSYLHALFDRGVNNRYKFRAFAEEYVGIDGDTADEVFSCATNAFRRDIYGTLEDTSMTRAQFSVGIIRLANLWTLMNEGMVETSKLASQTSAFLDSIHSGL